MKQFKTDERTGLKYELVGDYYLLSGDDELKESAPIGIWGNRHLKYLKEHCRVVYVNLLVNGELNDYLYEIDQQATDMMDRLVKDMVQRQGITEKMKIENQKEWVGKMNNIYSSAREMVLNDLIYA